MYFDDINADPSLINADLEIYVAIFRKSDNVLMTTVKLNRISANFINYSSNGCINPNIIRTRLLRYEGGVDLFGYTSPSGYYLIWERCCRNYVSKNIFHRVGQTFYLEFPPVSINGVRLYNSSPVFGVIAGDYLCKDNVYTYNFGGVDANGDELRYSMITPLKGNSSELDPIPSPIPAPYDSVNWKPGYNRTNQIPGNPPINVHPTTGLLTVNPSDTGLFVFAVRVEEYRNGVRIGQMIREFQYFVYDCPPTEGPVVKLNNFSGSSSNDTLIVYLNRDTCYSVVVSDSSSTFFNKNETVSIFYGNTNLPTSAFSFSPPFVNLNPSVDSASVNVCFSTCDKVLISKDSTYILDIVVTDNECPRKTDVLRTYVLVKIPPLNDKPVIYTDLSPTNVAHAYPDSLMIFNVYAKDNDPFDLGQIEVQSEVAFADIGMNYLQIYHGPDSAHAQIQWKPVCADIANGPSSFDIKFKINDKSCVFTHFDSVTVKVMVEDLPTEITRITPPNLVTLNEDDKNDYFHIPDMPRGNCTYYFKSVSIYNSWGARVFKSSDPNFKWHPTNVSDGMYYYAIDLNEKVIKGWIQVIR
ncbi:MAG: gliding motility-associated C-terminal domain-containing protein [Cytophagaceae bacterium]|nr:gliding motility-associated C-terminal domain-containing protein [Cytophagaceae bacterium]MDW8456609.1 gliding motility-associated C-terminal domain-containing protein [Cytophagaceae bacterium]